MNDRPNKTKLYLAVGLLLVLSVFVFAQAAFDLPFMKPAETDEFVVVYALSTLIFLVLLVFGFVLLRILVKVWVERKQEKPGSQFKTSLLVMLAILTLIPAISVFAYAYGLVNRNIDKWFSFPVDGILQTTNEIQRTNEAWLRENAGRLLTQLSRGLPADLEETRSALHLEALVLLNERGAIERSAADRDVFVHDIAEHAFRALANSDDAFINWGEDWISAQRIRTPQGERILAGVFPAIPGLATLRNELAEKRAQYDALKANRVGYQQTYALLNALMTVLFLFAAVWAGSVLSKRITEPIEALAAGTREISAGNLGYRVDVRARDELGMLVTTFNDMSSRLQHTTAELETRRHYQEVILESIPTGVISLDTDLRIHTLNRAARTMFSIEHATRLEDIFRDDDLLVIQSLLETATQNSTTREVSFSTPGRPGHSAVTASRLSAGGFILVVEDLTEVVRAQKASAWREVARRLAHEIKNPLTPIQLSAERISRNIARLPVASPRVTTVMQECVSAIVDEVSSLKNLVDEFVRFARLPAVSRVPHSMRELVDKTLALYEGRMEGIAVAVSVPRDLPAILMDPMQMKRVLINLIDNAVEALSGQPDRTLKIGCDLARDGTMARLTVEDNGIGIAPDDRERLFTPYFSTRKDGTGLGLAIVSRIIADHGGYIGAEPITPRGTRFVIELPVCQESLLSTTSRASGSR